MSPPATLEICWIIRRHMPEVYAIENASFEFPWSQADFIRCLHQRCCIGMVAKVDGRVVGFMIYELKADHYRLLNFAVAHDLRKQGVGRRMIEKLVGKLKTYHRHRICLEVRETNLGAQLFFRQLGFRATGVLNEFYENDEMAYAMSYTLPSDAAVAAGEHRR